MMKRPGARIFLRFEIYVICVALAGCATPIAHKSPIVRINLVASRIMPSKSGPGLVEQQWRASGSGFVVNQRGHVVTNAHVVLPKNTAAPWRRSTLKVVVDADSPTERVYPASIVASDTELDLAVLKIRGRWARLPSLPLGDRNDAVVGSGVSIRGFPGGGRYKVTTGKVLKVFSSAEAKTPGGAIQSDARAVPGNSGGPLLSNDGKVIGVVVSAQCAERLERRKARARMRNEMAKIIMGAMSDIRKNVREAGVESAELDKSYRESMAMMEEGQKKFRSAIQILNEQSPYSCAIPADAVRKALARWRIPLEVIEGYRIAGTDRDNPKLKPAPQPPGVAGTGVGVTGVGVSP